MGSIRALVCNDTSSNPANNISLIYCKKITTHLVIKGVVTIVTTFRAKDHKAFIFVCRWTAEETKELFELLIFFLKIFKLTISLPLSLFISILSLVK